jgi:hypothetical protein
MAETRTRWIAFIAAVVLASAGIVAALEHAGGPKPAHRATHHHSTSSTTSSTASTGAHSPPATVTGPQTGPAAAARSFLGGYLAFEYGHQPATRIAASTEQLRASLATNPPNVPPSIRALHPQLLQLQIKPGGHNAVDATATVNDGQETYTVKVKLKRTNKAWKASTVSPYA